MDTPASVAIVTGSSRGLGEILANRLNDNNWNLGLCARREINLKGSNIYTKKVDVGIEHEVRRFVNEVHKRFGKIDVIINDAGYCNSLSQIEHIKPLEVYRLFAVNVYGPYYFMKEILPIMKHQNKGLIINIASRSGLKPNSMLPMYSASKAALIAMSDAVSKDLVNTNVKCIYFAPGAMNTQMREDLCHDAKFQENPEVIADEIVGVIKNVL